MTWMTEGRNGASAAGAPTRRRTGAAVATLAGLQIQKRAGVTPAADGPGLVCGSSTATYRTNDHVEMGGTAWDGTPLGSSGAGYG